MSELRPAVPHTAQPVHVPLQPAVVVIAVAVGIAVASYVDRRAHRWVCWGKRIHTFRVDVQRSWAMREGKSSAALHCAVRQ